MTQTLTGAENIRWNLNDLYSSLKDPALERDRREALAQAQEFETQTRGQVAALDPAGLAKAMENLEAVLTKTYRAMVFAELTFAGDTQQASHGALLQACRETYSQVRQHLIFFDLEWLALDEKEADKLLADPALARWRHHLTVARAQKPYTLSEPEEQALEVKALTGRLAFTRLFDELVAGITCQVEESSPPVSLQQALSMLYRPQREQRAAAAKAITLGLAGTQRQFGFITNTLAQDHAGEDTLRQRPHPMAARNLENEISQQNVDDLLAACERKIGMVPRYYRLKARLLKLDSLADYDRYAPIRFNTPPVPFDKARRMVLDAYGAFSPKMGEIAALFFTNNWIDAEPRPGKAGGAFSASTLPDLHPYILMNYTGSLRDVMTLAHELGHGVHQYLSQSQGLFHMRTPLTTAETASVFGEMVVFRRLMAAEQDPATRLALLCGKLEDAFATVFRQAVMTRFEQSVHAARRAQGELDLKTLGELWRRANQPMFGNAVQMTEGYSTWWSYIPHFIHTPFYCYAYSFGELLVFALLARYDQEGPSFVPKYMALLASGGSTSPQALMKTVGLDISAPNFWDSGLAVLESMVDEAEALAEQAG